MLLPEIGTPLCAALSRSASSARVAARKVAGASIAASTIGNAADASPALRGGKASCVRAGGSAVFEHATAAAARRMSSGLCHTLDERLYRGGDELGLLERSDMRPAAQHQKLGAR